LEPGRWAQNTDPFVFGEQFHCTGCQQHKRRNGLVQPTQLRALAHGSVVLFGSCRRDRFVLDTVLVVDRWLDHTASDHRDVLAGRVSDTYRSVVIDPWYRGNVPEYASHRLYFGATPARPVSRHVQLRSLPTEGGRATRIHQARHRAPRRHHRQPQAEL
jgi:hypothetical protein